MNMQYVLWNMESDIQTAMSNIGNIVPLRLRVGQCGVSVTYSKFISYKQKYNGYQTCGFVCYTFRCVVYIYRGIKPIPLTARSKEWV